MRAVWDGGLRRQVSENTRFSPMKPQNLRSLFWLPPRRGTPDLTSAVLRHSQVQITGEVAAPLHRADEEDMSTLCGALRHRHVKAIQGDGYQTIEPDQIDQFGDAVLAKRRHRLSVDELRKDAA